jgi:hypothetical protein
MSSRQSSSLRGYMPLRQCQIVSRVPIGYVTVNGSGAMSSIGAFTPGTSTPYQIQPLNLGWLVDLAAHFAYWRLHKIRFVYTPHNPSPASTVAAPVTTGVAVFGVLDDPGRTVTPGANLYELRSARQVSLSERWSLEYVPTGFAAQWLFCSRSGSTGVNTERMVSAGTLLATSVTNSTLVSQNLGYLEAEYHVSLKGASLFVAPTLSTSVEEKKEPVETKAVASAASFARAAAAAALGSEEYELVEFRRPSSSGLTGCVVKKS